MDLTNKSEIKNLLKKHGAKPEKYLGQHFMLSKMALQKMVETAEIKINDRVVEVGPGLGTLTTELAKTGAHITAIEKDNLMISILKETLANFKNVKVIQADARQLSLPLPGVRHRVKGEKVVDKYKIVANLPYNVATFLIHQWLESENPPQMMVLMIQKEVAQRMLAQLPHSNVLAMSIQFYADAKIISYVSKELFWPKPKVDAAIVKIVPKKEQKQKTQNTFFAVVKAGFSQPRKQLMSNLAKKLKTPREKLIEVFEDLHIPEQARAENLSLTDWQKLAVRLTR